jgi:hypothetical protein
MSVSFPTKWHLFHKLILIICKNIIVFVKHVHNLNAQAEKFGELGHTAGI